MIDEDETIEWNATHGGQKRFRHLVSARNPALAKRVAIALQEGSHLEDLEIYSETGKPFALHVRSRSTPPDPPARKPATPDIDPAVSAPIFRDFSTAFLEEWGKIPPEHTAYEALSEIRRNLVFLAHVTRFPGRLSQGETKARRQAKIRGTTARCAALLEKLHVELTRGPQSTSSSSSSS